MDEWSEQNPNQKRYTVNKHIFVQYHINGKLKQSRTTILKQESKTLATPNAVENMDQQSLSFIPSEDAKWFKHFGR